VRRSGWRAQNDQIIRGVQHEKDVSTNQAEVHDGADDIFIVMEGTATLTLGGKLDSPSQAQPGEWRASSITGGTEFRLSKGDVAIVPRPLRVATAPAGFTRVRHRCTVLLELDRRLPRQSTRRRRPLSKHLPQDDDLAGVIAAVRRDGLKHFEPALGPAFREEISLARPMVQGFKATPETTYGPLPICRTCRAGAAGPATGRVPRKRGVLPVKPVHHPILPIDHVVQQLKD
jgi:mannose-6-phosphate isomerase-like protein (cupin superfamily)